MLLSCPAHLENVDGTTVLGKLDCKYVYPCLFEGNNIEFTKCRIVTSVSYSLVNLPGSLPDVKLLGGAQGRSIYKCLLTTNVYC